MSDLQQAFEALKGKKAHYDRLWQYYDGLQPLTYSTERLRDMFSQLDARFTQNWCAVVVDSVLERVTLRQWYAPNDDATTSALNAWWRSSGMALDDDDVHLCALVTGEAFVMVWPGQDELQAFYNDSRLVHAFYEPDLPRTMRYAAKWWRQSDGVVRLNLYYPELVARYATTKPMDELQDARALELVDEAPNPFAPSLPIFHFRREHRAIKSELAPSVLDTQDAINKLMADMMVASEFGAFKQRWVISNADIGTLKNSPNEIWDLPAGDGIGQPTQVGQFAETQLANFLDAMQALAAFIAKMTRTPQQYFWLGARADPSGEALFAMEAPLIHKTRKYVERFAAVWGQLGAFVTGQQVQAIFDEPATVQPFTLAQTRKANVDAGVPLATQLRREGWAPQDLAQLEADKRAEAAQQQASLATALLNAQRGFDQGGQ